MSQFPTDRSLSAKCPLRIVVLMGGWSAERSISLSSGRSVSDALRSLGHETHELDPAQMDVLSYPWTGVDAAFIALHGAFGEDGTVQSLLDDLQVPYTGSGAAASRLAMNKALSKQLFSSLGLPTPASHVVHVSEARGLVEAKAAALGYPMVVKPCSQGSSIGITIVEHARRLGDALDKAFWYDPHLLLEQFIAGRELTVAVLDQGPLPVIEIRPARPFFDYEAKYIDEATAYVFDTGLPPATIGRVQSLAVSATEALGCGGVARVDIRLDERLEPWLLEVNTVPGFTDHSLVPKAAAQAGIGFARFCESLVLAKLSPSPATHTYRAA